MFEDLTAEQTGRGSLEIEYMTMDVVEQLQYTLCPKPRNQLGATARSVLTARSS